MRYAPEHKDEVRRGIIAGATRALREAGVHGVSIPKLMKLAGLTHGGFYAHFKGRDELVAEAVEAAARETSERVFAGATTIDTLLEAYVSRSHVDHPGQGCVIAALGAEAKRQPAGVRRAFGYAARGLIELVSGKLEKARGSSVDERAMVIAATMVGAVVLGRAIDDPELSERLLSATKRLAKQLAA